MSFAQKLEEAVGNTPKDRRVDINLYGRCHKHVRTQLTKIKIKNPELETVTVVVHNELKIFRI